MKSIEEFKRRTEEGFRAFRETAEKIAVTMEREARIGKRYLDIRRLKREIEKVYGEIGNYVYDQISAGKTIEANDSFISDRVSLVDRMKREIKTLEEEIREIRLSKIEKEG